MQYTQFRSDELEDEKLLRVRVMLLSGAAKTCGQRRSPATKATARLQYNMERMKMDTMSFGGIAQRLPTARDK